MKTFNPNNVIGVDVFAEIRKKRRPVGRLTMAKIGDKDVFVFRYNSAYLKGPRSLALGPELPLTRIEHQSEKLFPSFLDRLPSPENPAYREYLAEFNLTTIEKNPLILLSTIGSIGPSSFIFEPVYKKESWLQLRNFRKELELSVRDYAAAFGLSVTVVQRIENNKGGKEALKRIELYKRFPETAIFEVNKNKGKLHESIKENLLNKLEQLIASHPPSRP